MNLIQIVANSYFWVTIIILGMRSIKFVTNYKLVKSFINSKEYEKKWLMENYSFINIIMWTLFVISYQLR